MRIVSSIALAALASTSLPSTTNAVKLSKQNANRTKNKKSTTIFHKNNVDMNKGTSAQRTILNKVSTARNQRREARTTTAADNGGESTQYHRRGAATNGVTSNMEKKTNVNHVDIMDRALERRTVFKEKKLKKATATDESTAVEEAAEANKFDKYQSPNEEGEDTEPAIPDIQQKKRRQTTSDEERVQRRKARQERRAARKAAGGASQPQSPRYPEGEEDKTPEEGKAEEEEAAPIADKRQRRTTAANKERLPNPRPGKRPIKSSSEANRSLADKHRERELRQPHSRTKMGVEVNLDGTTVLDEEDVEEQEKLRGGGGPTVEINNVEQDNFTTRNLKKSKKSSYSYSSKSNSYDWDEYDCIVRLTNLSKEQWFSDIFWMVHSDKVELPLWSYGFPVFDDLAILATDGDPYELIDYYTWNDDGVLEVDAIRGPLENGDSLLFGIPKSGSYDLFTMATSFIFSNDGFVSIDAGDIDDDATWFLWGLDAGVEANTQLCWTVQASFLDFPRNSECYYIDEDIADENDNSFPGEGFVYVHSGIHDLDDKRDLQDFLAFTCDDRDADSFVEYFSSLGFDDDFLLYDDDRGQNDKDDQDFLDFVEDNDDQYGNYIIFQIALDAGDFDEFCE